MGKKIISDITSLKEWPYVMQFSVVFVHSDGKTKEYIFFDNSIRQCVIKCTAFINYMFRFCGISVVYIFPTNDTTVLHTVYRKYNGARGDYKIVQCPIEGQMTLDFVRAKFLDS